MKVPTKPNHKKELEVFIQTILWAQRGNIKKACYEPNHPPVIIYRSVEEATDGKPAMVKLVKRGCKLFLVIDALEIDKEIQKFHYQSLPDRLMNYLLNRRTGDKVSKDDISETIDEATEVPIDEAFRKMKYWKAFRHYFMPVCTKHTLQIIDHLEMSPFEIKKLLKDFGIEWHEPEQPSK
ncbi:hypothetical protein A3K24_02500 [candidate division Kazan bacterium RIFCSPHIGHO2_01_FULL_44_14]|uniref:Uncharacterized protein n=1 Tax=candidate division Kazan bacterium RIFCSPLOWO2_01_FULL_45_19 TaxID=1798538 RepID=A0A1F4NQE6_UNCK3|nr:hypothetical protein [uncultured bacterium]AQS31109.1 hypothetical protein [uncultured bacterium]OGB73684.1 MAG: hypothetical protein A3K51_02500 [candidate division Kazan bacterium RIFCSPLOWO2_01_FULL_45_19]OGB77929.1 MAG: hypothetical protein A3K24_02500 [candidate division Kazan bacterium RIFCSPHIGHO2_01_FULL_44_14]